MPHGFPAPPGSQDKGEKGDLTLQQHRGHRRGPVEALGQQESAGSLRSSPWSCPVGRTHSTAAPPHPSPTGLQSLLLPPMVKGAQQPALPGAPRTCTPGTLLATTPCLGSTAGWLQAAPRPSGSDSGPRRPLPPGPGSLTGHSVLLNPGSVSGTVLQGAPSWGLCFRGIAVHPCHHRTVYDSSQLVGPNTRDKDKHRPKCPCHWRG